MHPLFEEAYKFLALAVLDRSLRDLAVPEEAQDAREFLLTVNEDLDFWCRLAGINTAEFSFNVKKLVASHTPEEISKMILLNSGKGAGTGRVAQDLKHVLTV